MTVALPALLLLGLTGCTEKAPACNDAAVIKQLKEQNKGDAILKRLVDSEFTISNIVDEGTFQSLPKRSKTTVRSRSTSAWPLPPIFSAWKHRG
jgi:hypothetical protein